MPETYQPTFDISSRFPNLHPKTTVILHPRRAKEEPHVLDSKIGGHIYWPRTDPWPTCPVDGDTMCAVLQLTADDVPELGFPEGKDLFQMLWCPTQDHEATQYGPYPECFWRRAVRDASADLLCMDDVPPLTEGFDSFVVPRVCTLSPERVQEYPSYAEMKETDQDATANVDDWIVQNSAADVAALTLDENENCYQYSWSVSPSTKVGGYVNWVQAVDHQNCDQCGSQMEHMLSIAGLGGYGGGGSKRWYPLGETRQQAMDGHNMDVMGGGVFYLFVCRQCEDMPIKGAGQR